MATSPTDPYKRSLVYTFTRLNNLLTAIRTGRWNPSDGELALLSLLAREINHLPTSYSADPALFAEIEAFMAKGGQK